MPNFRIRALGNRQQDAFTSEDRNAAAFQLRRSAGAISSALFSRASSSPERASVWPSVLGALRRPRPWPLGLFFVAAPLLVVELDPVVPALRADSADLLQDTSRCRLAPANISKAAPNRRCTSRRAGRRLPPRWPRGYAPASPPGFPRAPDPWSAGARRLRTAFPRRLRPAASGAVSPFRRPAEPGARRAHLCRSFARKISS